LGGSGSLDQSGRAVALSFVLDYGLLRAQQHARSRDSQRSLRLVTNLGEFFQVITLSLQCSVKNRIPTTKTGDELVEIDRNPRNLEVYLENNKEPVLTVGHLRCFLPFTSNLDPYLRKLIHGELTSF